MRPHGDRVHLEKELGAHQAPYFHEGARGRMALVHVPVTDDAKRWHLRRIGNVEGELHHIGE
jgi:hypothetical protein